MWLVNLFIWGLFIIHKQYTRDVLVLHSFLWSNNCILNLNIITIKLLIVVCLVNRPYNLATRTRRRRIKYHLIILMHWKSAVKQ